MRHSTIALALSTALATYSAVAGTETVLTFRYVAQENCVGAPNFTPFPDVQPYGSPWIGFSDFSGTLMFDLSNHKALFTHQGTWQSIPDPSGVPADQLSGQHPVLFWKSDGQCVLHFELSNDLSFSLQSTSVGCHATLVAPFPGTGNTDLDKRWTGQFAPDMQSFIAGHAGWDSQQQPVVETQRHDNGDVVKRICTSMMHGIRLGGGAR